MKSNYDYQNLRRKQTGLSLLIGLIMLVMLTLLAISAFNTSNISLRILGNTQVRQEALAAGQTAVEEVLSAPGFIKTPPAAVTVTLNRADYVVGFTPPPACLSVVDVLTSELNPSDADDLKCIPSSALQQSGVFVTGAPLPPSYCSKTRWAVTADVTEATTSARMVFEQGVAVRISKADAINFCP